MGHDFGMDMASVTAMKHLDSIADHEAGVFWFHEKINLPRAPVIYHKPIALAIETKKSQYHLVIEAPLDLPLSISMGQIKPFPALVEHFLGVSPLWAVYSIKESIILLVDPLKMFD